MPPPSTLLTSLEAGEQCFLEPEKGLGAPEEIAAGFDQTAGHLLHLYLTVVRSDKVNVYRRWHCGLLQPGL